MEDYGQYSRKKVIHSKLGVMRFFDYLVLLATIGCSALLLISYLSPVVNPNDLWIFSIIGLIAPILYIFDIVLLLYWLIVWKIFFFIPLTVLLLGVGNVTLFFRPTISRSYSEQVRDKSAINILSYNVIGFINPHNDRGESCLEEILSFAVAQNPDIMCFQEYQSTKKMPQRQTDSILSELAYKRINYKKQNSDSTGWGLAIFSRYPIINSGKIDFAESNNSALWVDVMINKDTVRVLNNHLQTTAINREDRDFITTQEFTQNNSDINTKRIRSILGKLRHNYKIRAQQADTIAMKIDQSPYPIIVCGDFNDTPMSYTYRTIRGDLKDAFSEKGHGITNTYRGFFNLFRIDYILYSPSFEALSYSSPTSDWSDHNPVLVSLSLPQSQSKK